MAAAPKWGTTPRQSIARECERIGAAAVVKGCVALLEGRQADPELILALGGRPARWAAGFDEAAGPAYWLRVWAARGLLWTWDDRATRPVLDALTDEAWRVREMAIRVVIRRRLRDAAPMLEKLAKDSNARVRKAADRALAKMTRRNAPSDKSSIAGSGANADP